LGWSLLASLPFPIKLSHRPAGLRGCLSISLSSASSLRRFLPRITPEFQALVTLSLELQPISPRDGRRRSAIRATRVTGLRPRSTVRELPFIVPLGRSSHPRSHLFVRRPWRTLGVQAKMHQPRLPNFDTRLCGTLLGSWSQDLGLRS
jgi:hypothetical protein